MSEMFLLHKNMYDKMIIIRFASKNAFSPISCGFEDYMHLHSSDLQVFYFDISE